MSAIYPSIDDLAKCIDQIRIDALRGEWSSMAYDNIRGHCEITISGDKLICTLDYSAESAFRPSVRKVFELKFIKNAINARIIAQTPIDCAQMFAITLNFSQGSFMGYYSSIHPADCGIITLKGKRQQWLDAFDM